jgi:hypothetical protein
MTRPSLAVRLLALALCSAAACGGSEAPELALARNVWTWVDVPGSACSDGSETGIAVNRGDDDREVLLVLDGGGACWDTITCFTAQLAKPGPYGSAEFDRQREEVAGSVLDRSAPANPFARATLVFVPYCTGDVHAGDAVQSYPRAPRRYHHKGRVNVARALDFLQGALPAPAKVVVSGASAGGFGSVLAFDEVRRRWPLSRGYLVDDSGPPLVGNDINAALRAAWFVSWRLDESVLPLCPACATDLSRLFPVLAEKYPDDRFALLSSTRDQVIRSFVLLDAAAFEAAILRLADERIAPLAQARTFLVPGTSHTMIGRPDAFVADGIPLTEWLRRMVDDDPAWTSVGP